VLGPELFAADWVVVAEVTRDGKVEPRLVGMADDRTRTAYHFYCNIDPITPRTLNKNYLSNDLLLLSVSCYSLIVLSLYLSSISLQSNQL
jgi:hypothetical protein